MVFFATVVSALGVPFSIAFAETEFSFQKKLLPTSQTEDVAHLQEILKSEGLFCEGCKVTGYFGYWTQAGLMNLQERYNLPITGIVNEETRAKLNQLAGFVESSETIVLPAVPEESEPRPEAFGQEPVLTPRILELDETQIIDINVKIAELVAQIAELTQELTILQGEEPSSLQAETEITSEVYFSAPLFLDMRNKDVQKLQEFLAKDSNVYPEGLITGYFGLLTHAAVVRFQEKYAGEILSPIGLLAGTGFVGNKTLAKLNELFGADISAQPSEGESIPEANSSVEAPQGTEEAAVGEVDDTPSSSIGGGGSGGGESSPAPDTSSPSTITNLDSPARTISSVTLTWTSPGDDVDTGTATTYDVRYSTLGMTEGIWISATKAVGEPTPQVAGASESMIVSGLTINTTYYFAIKTMDEAGNESSFSNIISRTAINTSPPPPPVTDTTAPSSIINLAVSSPAAFSVRLSWPAPGDDGDTGTATSYDIRYSTSNITESNWATATQVAGEPTPQVAGTSESMTVSGLAITTAYYFTIKTMDEASNESALSNVVTSTTVCTILPGGVSTYSISSASSPRITQVALALELEIGVPQVVTVEAQEATSVTGISATIQTDNESNTFSLSLISGTAENGTWQGQRTVTDTHCGIYSATISATSDLFTSTINLSFR